MSNQSNMFPPAAFASNVESQGRQKSLNEMLTDFALYIEKNLQTSVYASILLLDASGKRLFRGAAPSLPEEYSRQIDGIEIGPQAGSCGTAVFCGHSIYAADIENDVLWKPFRKLADQHNLRACWSVPIISKKGVILGTFALYYNFLRNPTQQERKFIEECAAVAAQLIEAKQDVH